MVNTFARCAAMTLILVVVGQTGLALDGDVRRPSSGQAAGAVYRQPAVPEAPLPCSYKYSSSCDYSPYRYAPCAVPRQPAIDCEYCYCPPEEPCEVWTIDYLTRPYFNSHTCYQFGTAPTDPDWPPPGYAPLSKLDFALDSTWTGMRVGVENSDVGIHFEWLAPIQRHIDGHMVDYDWNILSPRDDPSRLDSQTLSSQRWNEGQMLDLGGRFKLADLLPRVPLEVWPMLGFRWQRFGITCSGLDYVVPAHGPQPQYDGVDVLTFNQQYYLLYIGGQLRTEVHCLGVPVAVTFQGDWAGTWGYNVDHHLLYELYGIHRYTMESTSGGAMHLALIAEALISRRLSVGLQADHLAIRTTGSHRWAMTGAASVDMTWDNGVTVKSDQTSLTAFVRARY